MRMTKGRSMKQAAAQRPRRAGYSLAQRLQDGGLMIIGGPPFGGKSLLASRMVESLPYAIKLEAIDNLVRPTERWYPSPMADAVTRPATKMLSAAQSIWWDHLETMHPVIVLSARFETPTLRRRAHALAQRLGARFLFVEAMSSNIRALRRVSRKVIEPHAIERRIANYERAVGRYRKIDDVEAGRLPCLRLTGVLSDLDAAVGAALTAWADRAP